METFFVSVSFLDETSHIWSEPEFITKLIEKLLANLIPFLWTCDLTGLGVFKAAAVVFL